MHLGMIGLSHQTAGVAFRERVALDQDSVKRTLHRLRQTVGVEESLVVSTCNRTEIYAVFDSREQTVDGLVDLLADETGVPRAELDGHVYRHVDRDVVQHLFTVTSGLDSMVVGENQILAQVRDAYANAMTCHTKGPMLDALMHRAFKVGKQVRTKTGIGEGRLSVASVACDLAEKIFHDLSQRRVLLVGAGETGELALTHLADRGIAEIVVTNRTLSRAEDLAARFGGTAVPFEDLWGAVVDADILISATAATEPVITHEPLRRALGRRGTPLFIIDIAVPRDVDPAVDHIEDVFLYDLDALHEVVKETESKRRAEVHRARSIVEEATANFTRWERGRAVAPTIVQVREQFEAIRTGELAKLDGRLSAEDYRAVDRATRAMVNKLLHHPTVHIKQAAQKPGSNQVIEAFRLLLGLEGEGGA